MTEPTSNLPEQYQPYAAPPARQTPVPAHHRPPNVIYDEHGRPVHVVLGQPSQAPIIVQMPERPGMDPALQRLIIVTFLILAVVVVCTACACAVVVLMGGTLIGIIGAVGSNLTLLACVLGGLVLSVGWAAARIRPAAKTTKKRR